MATKVMVTPWGIRRPGSQSAVSEQQFDVVVVGAGPAGSICARNLATKGYRVLLAEKRPVVGVPVRCGEATGTRGRISDFTRIREEWIETDIHGVILHGPEGVDIRYDKQNIGTMIDRKLFDQDLAYQARDEGADLRLQTRVTGIGEVKNGSRQVTLVEQSGHEQSVLAKMVVAADGAESLCGRLVGLKTRQLPPHVCSAIEFRIEAQDQNPNHYTFWIGHEAVKKGYIWIFPKVKSGVVNLGAGDVTPKMGAKNMYDVTMEMKNRYFPDAKLLEVHGGAVPVSGNMVEYVADRFALVGDAAHHTNPMTGGGIISGMCAADFAATRIAEGLTAGNLSKEFLFGYQEAVWNRFGRNHEKERKIASFLFTIDKKGQVRFLRALKGMVQAKFSRFSKLWGYLQIAQVALQNAQATLKVLRQKPVA